MNLPCLHPVEMVAPNGTTVILRCARCVSCIQWKEIQAAVRGWQKLTK